MAQTTDTQPDEREFQRLMAIEAREQRRKAIEEMTQQFENDMQPDGIPYTVSVDHLTDRITFIQGLRNAGFEIHDEHVVVIGPETITVAFASGVHARRAMLALHLRELTGMEGKKMYLTKASPQMTGLDHRSPCAPVPTYATVMQAMGEAFHERTVAPRKAEEAAVRLARKACIVKRSEEKAKEARSVTKAENVAKKMKEMDEARLAKQARMARMARMASAQAGKAAAQARKEANIKHAQEMKLAADLRRAEKRKKVEDVERVNKSEKVVKSVEEMEEARMASMAAAQARKAANIKYNQEMKLAKDLRRAESRKNAEEGELRKEAKKMAQWDNFAPDEKAEDESDGFEEMEEIESMAGQESQWDTSTPKGELEALSADEEREISAWLEAMKQ